MTLSKETSGFTRRETFLPLSPPAISQQEIDAVIDTLRSSWITTGPRPEDPRYVALYTPQQQVILNYRPGITSAAPLRYRAEEQQLSGTDWERAYIEHVMPIKLALELNYSQHANLFTDIWLILPTVVAR